MRKGDVKGKVLFKQSNTPKIKYADLAKMYLKISQAEGKAEETIKTYQHHTKYFLRYIGQDAYCTDLNSNTLTNYVLYLREVRKITNGITINSYLRNISPVLKFGMKKGYITEWFNIPWVKEQETFKEIYTPQELDILLEHPKKNNFANIRTWTIIWTLASTGIRAKELRQLIINNVDLLNRVITVNNTKNRKPRYLPISQSFSTVLEEYLKIRKGEGKDYLFCTVYGGELSRTGLQKSVYLYNKERGISKRGMHLFRHTFITNAVNKNVNPLILKKITGHTTMKQLNRYYNAKTTDIVKVIDDIAPKIQGKESLFKKGGRK